MVIKDYSSQIRVNDKTSVYVGSHFSMKEENKIKEMEKTVINEEDKQLGNGTGANGYHNSDESPWSIAKSAQEIRSFYRSYGPDWFNKFPKTDNTYLPSSKWYGYFVAPGIPLIPNLARKPLRDTMDKQQQFSRSYAYRRRVTETTSTNNNISTPKITSSVDSDDSDYDISRENYYEHVSWYRRIVITIVTICTTIVTTVVTTVTGSPPQTNVAGRKHMTSVGSASVPWYRRLFNWIYRFLSFIHVCNIRVLHSLQKLFGMNRNRKLMYLRYFVIFLLLLPFIILTIWSLWQNSEEGTYSSWLSALYPFDNAQREDTVSVTASSQVEEEEGKTIVFSWSSLGTFFVDILYSAGNIVYTVWEYLLYFTVVMYELVISSLLYLWSLLVSSFVYVSSVVSPSLLYMVSAVGSAYTAVVDSLSSYFSELENAWNAATDDSSVPSPPPPGFVPPPPGFIETLPPPPSGLVEDLPPPPPAGFRETVTPPPQPGFVDSVLPTPSPVQQQSIRAKGKMLNVDDILQSEKFRAYIMQIQNEKNKEEIRLLVRNMYKETEQEMYLLMSRYDEKLAVASSKLENLDEKIQALEKMLAIRIDKLLSGMVRQQQLEDRLNEFTKRFSASADDKYQEIYDKILIEVKERVKMELTAHITQVLREQIHTHTHIDEKDWDSIYAFINSTVQRKLAIYDADKTGKIDYAMGSSGGTILSIRCTEPYVKSNAYYQFLGIPLWSSGQVPPTVVIQPGVQPGECWPFAGTRGNLVIELSHNITITGFVMEHIPKSISPLGHIDSAPKNFNVLGLVAENDLNGTLLGNFTYEDNGISLQEFSALSVNKSFKIVELQIESNHGNVEYTCLYRFRVHGIPQPEEDIRR